jgi:NTE family protein
MSVEYLLVVYKQDREVLADGDTPNAPLEPGSDIRQFLQPGIRPGSATRALITGGVLALLALAPAACETVPDYPNRPLATGAANPPPADLIGTDPRAPLILIAFSGGGSRAAAVGLGVLDELAAQTYPATGKPVTLIDRVKVVSSISGGSVVAAWFGLVGPARLDELKNDFLARDNIATLEWEAADPLTLARLSLSRYSRIDALRDLLDRELFHGARFADLRRPSAPLVVMNATDMESGKVFAFTPQRFVLPQRTLSAPARWRPGRQSGTSVADRGAGFTS